LERQFARLLPNANSGQREKGRLNQRLRIVRLPLERQFARLLPNANSGQREKGRLNQRLRIVRLRTKLANAL